MSQTLFLAWQDSTSRKWYPVGRFRLINGKTWEFQYLIGAQRAQEEAGFDCLASFPDFYQTYTSPELFPMLKNRLMSSTRGDYGSYLTYLGFDPSEPPSELEILARSGGSRATDSLELFPSLEPGENGEFSCEFFLRRRHLSTEEANQTFDRQILSCLEPGQPLQLAIEFNNPGGYLRAVQLQTLDMEIIGYTPNYLVDDLCEGLLWRPALMQAQVMQVNPSPAPRQRRVLIQVKGVWRPGYEPMSGEDFASLSLFESPSTGVVKQNR